MSVIARLRTAVRCDRGFTIGEFAVASAILMTAAAMIAGFLVSATNGSIFAHGQSQTLNDVRNAMQQIEKEVRGAESLVWCSPAGSCLEVAAQTADGGFRTVRYTHTANELRRAIFDGGSGTWRTPQPIIARVTNTVPQPVFACDTQSTLLKVTVDLHIEPTPVSNPNLHVQTSVRPRNFPSIASCP
jgi:hypothetical protein